MALNINDILCPEIFVKHIFKCLCYDDLKNAMLTCKKWKTFAQMLYEVDERIKCKLLFILPFLLKSSLHIKLCFRQSSHTEFNYLEWWN